MSEAPSAPACQLRPAAVRSLSSSHPPEELKKLERTGGKVDPHGLGLRLGGSGHGSNSSSDPWEAATAAATTAASFGAPLGEEGPAA